VVFGGRTQNVGFTTELYKLNKRMLLPRTQWEKKQ